MSTNEKDKHNSSKKEHVKSQYQSGMTPSIITTINNTSPTPVNNCQFTAPNNNNHSNNSHTKSRRPSEPFYESYIEDSFVGHWEREDDDDENVCQQNNPGNRSNNGVEDEEVDLHPSTIEFDFDSFGPESFIYAPSASKQTAEAEPIKENIVVTSQTHVAKSEPEVPQETNAVLVRTPAPIHGDNFIDMSQIDLRVIEPYKRVISHAGYCHHLDPSIPAPKVGEPAPAIIVFSACYLPDRSRHDYNYVMDHLFLYVLSSLHELIADDYILLYLHNTHPTKRSGSMSRAVTGTSDNFSTSTNQTIENQNNLPTFTWIKRCYQMIDRRLRKNLKILYLVKPTFWLKTIVIMCKPFISAKFSRKLRLVEDVDDLKKRLPIEQLILPPSAENL